MTYSYARHNLCISFLKDTWESFLYIVNINPTLIEYVAYCNLFFICCCYLLYLFIYLSFLALNTPWYTFKYPFGVSSLQPRNFPVTSFCTEGPLAIISIFIYLELSFFHLHFWKILSLSTEHLGFLLLLLFTTFIISFHFHLASLWAVAFCYGMNLFFSCIYAFSCIFVFQQFYNAISMIFFVFILYVLFWAS